jgi:predicted phosphoribosyltransferase
MEPIFRDRTHAGRVLAGSLRKYSRPETLVLALPRGGVPVAFEIAMELGAELDVFLVRKLGLPGQEELAIGAIASGGVRVVNERLVEALHLSRQLIDSIAEREVRELGRRESAYRDDRPPVQIAGRPAIVVDDGLATGSTMLAAVRAIRAQDPGRLVVAVPVAAAEACHHLRAEADEVVCGATPKPFDAVGNWYEDFNQTSDEEVQALLRVAAQSRQR